MNKHRVLKYNRNTKPRGYRDNDRKKACRRTARRVIREAMKDC